MNDLLAKLTQPSLWTVSVRLLILYAVSVAIFFAAHAVHAKAGLALNFLGVLAIVSVAAVAAFMPRAPLT